MANSNIVTNHYRYKVSSLVIIIPGENDVNVLPGLISDFEIIKDFDNNIFPIFHINIKLDTATYYRILENKTTVKFKLRVEKYIHGDSFSNSKVAFDEVFAVYLTK